MIHVFIDTNIWIRILSQGRPGCELEHLHRLRDLVIADKLKLVVPEIVELELEKLWRGFQDDIVRTIGVLEADINKAIKVSWNEIEDVKEQVIELVRDSKEKKKDQATKLYADVQSLITSAKAIRIPLTPDLLFQGKKRLIAGRMPKPDNSAHNDATIVESLLGHFAKDADKHELYVCCENKADFGLDTETKEGWVLHPLVEKGLPKSKLFLTLQEMFKFYDSNTAIVEPPPEVIEKALESEVKKPRTRISSAICEDPGCIHGRWVIGPFCRSHYVQWLAALPKNEHKTFQRRMEKHLNYYSNEIKRALWLRLGLADGELYSLDDIAAHFRLSRETIARVLQPALVHLQRTVRQDRVLQGLFRGTLDPNADDGVPG